MFRLPPVLLFALCASAVSQDAPKPAEPAPQTLEQLAAKVEAAHKIGAVQEAVTAFAATILMQELARSQEHRVDAELDVKFREWKQPDGRPWPLFRYHVLDTATKVEQGRDRIDFWGLVEGKAIDLTGKDYEKDRNDCRRYLKLAQQMVQFLDPATVLRGLKNPSTIALEELKLGRAPSQLACFTVSGDLDSFPLRHAAGDNAAVRIKAYVDRDRGRLVALDVQSRDADGKLAATGERLQFGEHAAAAGRVVPHLITHYDFVGDEQPRAQLKMTITTLRLGAELRAEDFDRPAKK